MLILCYSLCLFSKHYRYNAQQIFKDDLFVMLPLRFLCLSTLVIFSLYSHTLIAKPVEEILWLQSKTPPFHLDADDSQSGLCDNLTEQLISTIKGVKHTRLVLPQKRINKYINEGKNVCFPCAIYKHSANKQFIYSIPTSIYPPFNIITTAAKAPELTTKHGIPINLVSLLTDESFTYGQADARRFSVQINNIIENSLTHSNVSMSWSSDNESGVVMERLKHGSLDYSLDYPFITSYFNKGNQSNIVNLAIAQNKNKLVPIAVGCATNAPNDFASQAIKKINHALKNSILVSEQYKKNQEYWLNEHFEDFNKTYSQHVLNFDSQTNDAPINTADQNKEQR